MDQNELLFARYMNDRDFQKVIAESLGAEVYQRLANTSSE
jgi:type I restriction enzyme R subunit